MNIYSPIYGFTANQAAAAAQAASDTRKAQLTIKGAIMLCVAAPCLAALLAMAL